MSEADARRWGYGRNRPPSPARGPGGSWVAVGDKGNSGRHGNYYGVPVIHRPHWKWLIVVYFFLGGIAGAAYVIATVAELFGPPGDRRLVRVGRYVSLAALIPSPILLVLDLGRPHRFLNIAALLPRSTGRVVGALGTPFAFFVGGYTGTLLGATAVPLWTKRAVLLGPLFLCSAFSTAVSAIAGVLRLVPGTPSDTLHRLERLEQVAILSELSVLLAWLTTLGPTAKPVSDGATGRALRAGEGAGLVLPLCLQAAGTVLPPRVRRWLGLTSSLLVLGGGLALRYAVVVGGHASADDPHATFDLTRKPPLPELGEGAGALWAR